MANPEERPDDRPELPTRVPFAGPHPGTVERDWKSPAAPATPPPPPDPGPTLRTGPEGPGQRQRTALPRAAGIGRQRGTLAGGTGPAAGDRSRPARPGPDPAGNRSRTGGTGPDPAGSRFGADVGLGPAAGGRSGTGARAATPEPAGRVSAAAPLQSRVLPAAVAASILVAGALWWSQDRAAPAAPQSAPAPAAVPTMRITAPGTDSSAGVGSDTAATKSASSADSAATGGPASSGGSPLPDTPKKPAAPSPTAGAAVNTSGRNLALGSRATASSIEGRAWEAGNAVDGDITTRWSSQFSDPQWLTVDLGKRWQISEILLHWENAHATAYRVEVSTDGEKWKRVYSTTAGQGGDVTVQVPKLPGRLIRMYGTKRSTQYGFSMLDVEVR